MRRTWAGVAVLAALAAACTSSSTDTDGGRRDGGLAADGGADGGAGAPQVSITANPNPGMVGQSVTFTAAISGGTPPYASCQWRFFAGASDTAGSLAGSTCTGQHSYVDDGDFVVHVEVTDSASRTGTGNLLFRVNPEGGASLPDLTIVSGSVAILGDGGFARYPPGSQITIRFTARNIGAGNAPASAAKVSIRNLTSNATTDLGNAAVGPLAPSAEETVTNNFTIPAGQAPGPYEVIVTADGSNAVPELNENNNSATLASGFEVTGPDGGT
jgi:hypothetical protein